MTLSTPSPTRAGRRARAVLLLTAAAVAATDLATKAAAARALAGLDTVGLPGPVNLRLLFNPGAAFGLGAALPAGTMTVVTAILAAGLLWYAWRVTPTIGRLSRSGLAVLLGGAVANLIDRSADGVVTDYLHTGWWPTFNLADVAIITGAGLLLLGTLRTPTRTEAEVP